MYTFNLLNPSKNHVKQATTQHMKWLITWDDIHCSYNIDRRSLTQKLKIMSLDSTWLITHSSNNYSIWNFTHICISNNLLLTCELLPFCGLRTTTTSSPLPMDFFFSNNASFMGLLYAICENRVSTLHVHSWKPHAEILREKTKYCTNNIVLVSIVKLPPLKATHFKVWMH